ncbi:hypothetical protein CDD80_869 [Ophiocordyceps camponoti-rufipedis]|uniref:DNA repair protein RAD50 n=1 Tax=Ophiocordyceps camponoti-rufipedis TaxID=2004952 RepID=A0A2C5ZBK7_9HYPO|nr:hypothetical protein CDD80_869 [Ophiocordyceps camponoti-rufipedis]
MSHIDKLSISGVRSFSPAVREAIQFGTPLTLIVGYNGSGKTTIIECLKYATTGELPPNSKGGAFIHDPKLCGEKEVMAQVKLQFHSINNRQHVATRSLQLSVKKTTRSQKTLDCSLVVVNNGERTTTSTRQAQLDEMIPERLGVSPAILDSVIFCHQDDSLWPLSEPAALKKRFDEIFEALKYTKAIENLKLLRKKQVEQLGKLQSDEAHNKVNKDRGERAEKRMTLLQSEIEAAREKCDALSAEMEETNNKIREKREQANSFLRIVHDLGNKREQLEYRQEAVDELRQKIDELDGDDASLQEMLSQYEQSMERSRQEAEKNQTQYNELQRKLAQHRRDLAAKLSEQGKHQSDKDKYERQLASRAAMIQEAARTYSLRGYDGQLGQDQVKSFNDKMQKLLDDKKRERERVQRENSAELDKATAVITELEGSKAARTQDRVSAKQRFGAIEKRIGVLKNEVSCIDMDQGAKAVLDSQLADVDNRLQRAQREAEKADWDRQLSEENDKLWQLESEHEKLGRELVECTRQASERAQLDLRKKELADRKRKLETLTETWAPKLSSVVGQEWEPSTLEAAFQSVLTRHTKAAQEARKKRDLAREKQQKVEYELRSAKESRDKKSHEAAKCKEQVLAALQKVRDKAVMDDYQEEVESVEQRVEELKNELSLFDALVDYYNKCKRLLVSKKKCLLCERHFDEGQSASLERLSNKIDKHLDPKGKAEVERDLGEETTQLEQLRAVRSAHDTHQRLCNEVAATRDDIKKLEAEYDVLDRQLDEVESEVSAEEEKLRETEGLSRTVATMTQTVRETREAEAQVERMTSQQASLGASGRDADEMQEAQAKLAEQTRSLKARMAKTSSERQRMRDQLSALELERSELNNKLGRAAGQLEKKADLSRQMEALREEHSREREAMQGADRELEALEPRMSEARAARDEVLRRGREREQAAADEADGVAGTVSELRRAEAEMRSYEERGGADQLAANRRAVAGLEAAVTETESDMSALTERANRLKDEMDKSDGTKKNMVDNLHYRRHLRTLEVLRREIAELETRRADEDHSRLEAEARTLENTANRLLAERGSAMGSMTTKDEELGRLLEEWEMDYKDAKQRYREAHIRVETTRAAVEDLGRCSAAVDKAVMQFHATKMAEVNRIAAELWQSTYQGTDIDTILIRSDSESPTSASSSSSSSTTTTTKPQPQPQPPASTSAAATPASATFDQNDFSSLGDLDTAADADALDGFDAPDLDGAAGELGHGLDLQMDIEDSAFGEAFQGVGGTPGEGGDL